MSPPRFRRSWFLFVLGVYERNAWLYGLLGTGSNEQPPRRLRAQIKSGRLPWNKSWQRGFHERQTLSAEDIIIISLRLWSSSCLAVKPDQRWRRLSSFSRPLPPPLPPSSHLSLSALLVGPWKGLGRVECHGVRVRCRLGLLGGHDGESITVFLTQDITI